VPDLLVLSFAIPFLQAFRRFERVVEIGVIHSDGNRGQTVRLGLNETVSELLSTFVRCQHPSINRIVVELNFRDIDMVPSEIWRDHADFALKSLSPLFHDHLFVIVLNRASLLLGLPGVTNEDVEKLQGKILKGFARAAWSLERLHILEKTDEKDGWGLWSDLLYLECVPELALGETAVEL